MDTVRSQADIQHYANIHCTIVSSVLLSSSTADVELLLIHFSSPGRTVGSLCACPCVYLCVRAIAFELNDIKPTYTAC